MTLHTVLASYAHGRVPADGARIIRMRAASLEAKAAALPADSAERTDLAAEAARTRTRALQPGQWSTAARSERLRSERIHHAAD